MKKLLLMLAVMCITFASCKKEPSTTYECVVGQYESIYDNHPGLYPGSHTGYYTSWRSTTQIRIKKRIILEFFNQYAADQYAKGWYYISSAQIIDEGSPDNTIKVVNLDSCTCTLKD